MQDEMDREDDPQGKVQDKVNKEKQDQEKLDKKVKEMFEGWESDKKQELRDIKDILKKYPEQNFYLSFLKQVAD
jgi:hypothetical protein